jgi:integrase
MIRDFGSQLVEQYAVMDREFQATGHLSPGWRGKNAQSSRRRFAQTRKPLVLSLRDGEAVDVSTLDGPQFRTLIRHLEIACFIVLAGMVGMRVSEIGSVKRGCLSTSVLIDGRRLVLLRAVIHKTSKEPAGTPRDWAAGWDGPANPVRCAIAVLEALRAIDKPHTDYLFVSSRNRNTREQKTLIRQVQNVRLNDFAAFAGITGWRLRTHQFRKTFARFITKRDYTGLLALKNHFGHLAIQMTEIYGSWDDDLVPELLDAEIEHDYEALDQILSSDRLAGKLGERIATQNQRLHGLAGAAARAEYIDNIKSDPSSDRLSLVRHEYGFCVLEAESAACGLDAWRVWSADVRTV